jgi:hypothetical protein
MAMRVIATAMLIGLAIGCSPTLSVTEMTSQPSPLRVGRKGDVRIDGAVNHGSIKSVRVLRPTDWGATISKRGPRTIIAVSGMVPNSASPEGLVIEVAASGDWLGESKATIQVAAIKSLNLVPIEPPDLTVGNKGNVRLTTEDGSPVKEVSVVSPPGWNATIVTSGPKPEINVYGVVPIGASVTGLTLQLNTKKTTESKVVSEPFTVRPKAFKAVVSKGLLQQESSVNLTVETVPEAQQLLEKVDPNTQRQYVYMSIVREPGSTNPQNYGANGWNQLFKWHWDGADPVNYVCHPIADLSFEDETGKAMLKAWQRRGLQIDPRGKYGQDATNTPICGGTLRPKAAMVIDVVLSIK